VSAYDVDVDVSNDVLIGGVVVMIAARSVTHRSKSQIMKHKVKYTKTEWKRNNVLELCTKCRCINRGVDGKLCTGSTKKTHFVRKWTGSAHYSELQCFISVFWNLTVESLSWLGVRFPPWPATVLFIYRLQDSLPYVIENSNKVLVGIVTNSTYCHSVSHSQFALSSLEEKHYQYISFIKF